MHMRCNSCTNQFPIPEATTEKLPCPACGNSHDLVWVIEFEAHPRIALPPMKLPQVRLPASSLVFPDNNKEG